MENEQSIFELKARFDNFKGTPEGFLELILTAHATLHEASSTALARITDDNQLQILMIYPKPDSPAQPPEWIAQSAQILTQNISAAAPRVIPLPATKPDSPPSHLVLIPGQIQKIGHTITLLFIENKSKDQIELILHKSELTSRLTALNDTSALTGRLESSLNHLKSAMQIVSAINSNTRFKGMAMALCNEIASLWNCERVALGFLKGRYIHLKAMSHTEDFSRKMQIVQDIEAAMEECLDQDIEILAPTQSDSTSINRAAAELAKNTQTCILSLPVRTEGTPAAVLTLQAPADKPFTPDQVETLRLTCELFSPQLLGLHETDRWIGARIAHKIRKILASLLGSEHTWMKITAILVFAALIFMIFAKGQFKIEAPFVLEATRQQIVSAPFEGYLKEVEVEVGDPAQSNQTVLASLDTAELRLQLAAAKAEKVGYLKQEAAAMRDSQTAQAQIAKANADKAQAKIDLLEHQLNQSALVSPLTGTVVTGDLKRQIGAPVKTGDVLFEVTPLESLRAQLMVPEDLIHEVQLSQEGYLATFSYPAHRLRFTVERINPAAELVNQRNVFKVRVQLDETRDWMRPGMEGVAKINVGKRPYIWIWTRKIINWIRMKLWI